jgi:hypothetical protein
MHFEGSSVRGKSHEERAAFGHPARKLNRVTAKKNTDDSVAVQFGGCDGKIPNCLPTMPSWNYMVRLYRPRAEVLSGTWEWFVSRICG